jgi:hypothetical protein
MNEHRTVQGSHDEGAGGRTRGEAEFGGGMSGPSTGAAPPHRKRARGRATRRRRPESVCLNCGDPTPGEFCPSCGQQKVEVLVSMRTIILDLLDDEFVINRRLPRTLFALFFRPGHLTVEHVNGRIVRYLRPFKLYLVSSVIFFLLLSFFSLRALREADLQFGGVSDTSGRAASVENIDSARVEVRRLLDDPSLTGPRRAALQEALRSLDQGAGSQPAERPLENGDTTTAAGEPRAPRTIGELLDIPSDGWQSNLTTGVAAVDVVLTRRARELLQMTPRQALERTVGNFLGYIPTVMFVLLPVFALMLKLLYVRRRRFYAEHFVFLLHVHAFVYMIFAALLVMRGVFTLPTWLALSALLWVGIYIFVAMRRVYGQGRGITLVKYWLLGLGYILILAFSVPVALMISLLV